MLAHDAATHTQAEREVLYDAEQVGVVRLGSLLPPRGLPTQKLP